MQGSGLGGATRNRLDDPEDDWLGDISDYDWSENAAEHAGRDGDQHEQRSPKSASHVTPFIVTELWLTTGRTTPRY